MPSAGKKMKPLDDEIARLDAEIGRLQGERAGLLRAKDLLIGGAPTETASQPRRRAASVKPHVLDYMSRAGVKGATTAEVDATIRLIVPEVAKDTVGSLLSRLKSEGALIYEGDRYYEKKYAPSVRNPFRVVL